MTQSCWVAAEQLTAAPQMLPGLPLSLHLSLPGQPYTNIAHAQWFVHSQYCERDSQLEHGVQTIMCHCSN